MSQLSLHDTTDLFTAPHISSIDGELLGGYEVDDHADDAGASGAAAQVHTRVPDFVFQQLVQLPAQLFHQLSHLGEHTNTGWSGVLATGKGFWISVFPF